MSTKFVKNTLPTNLSLISGRLLFKPGQSLPLAPGEFDYEDVVDALRRGWLEHTDTLVTPENTGPKIEYAKNPLEGSPTPFFDEETKTDEASTQAPTVEAKKTSRKS